MYLKWSVFVAFVRSQGRIEVNDNYAIANYICDVIHQFEFERQNIYFGVIEICILKMVKKKKFFYKNTKLNDVGRPNYYLNL